MSASLQPVIVSLDQVQKTLGSGNKTLLQQLITEQRDQFLDIDANDIYYEDFESEIEAEYDAYERGDFSFKATIVPEDSLDEEDDADDDQEIDDIVSALKSRNNTVLEKKLTSFIGDIFSEATGSSKESDETPVRELTTGAALADLVLDRERDSAYGFKYGIALLTLCEHLGTTPSHDAWVETSSDSFSLISEAFSKSRKKDVDLWEDLFGTNCPISLPDSDDGPTIGFIANQELDLRIKPYTACPDDLSGVPEDSHDWLKDCLADLANWYDLARTENRDLILFYS